MTKKSSMCIKQKLTKTENFINMCDSTRDSPELALITWLSGENLQM